MPTVTVGTENGSPIDVYFEDHGSGKPVVLIHGWPLSGKSWEGQVGPLVDAGYRVITYDRRGFGQSDKPWAGYDYDTLAADLEVLLTHLDLHDVTLVGFSMGGGEVARHWGNYGGNGRVTKLVFASAVPPYLYKTEGNDDGGLTDEMIEQFQGGVTGDRPDFLHTFTSNFYTPEGGKELVSDATHDFAVFLASPASPKGTLDCITSFGKTDFRKDLDSVTVPTLVIHGDGDQVVPFAVSGKRTAETVKDAQLHVIEGAPHGCNVTHTEEFNRVLIDFLG